MTSRLVRLLCGVVVEVYVGYRRSGGGGATECRQAASFERDGVERWPGSVALMAKRSTSMAPSRWLCVATVAFAERLCYSLDRCQYHQ